MEYYENNNLFNPIETEKVMSIPKQELFDYLSPELLPIVMKNVMREHFHDNNYQIYPFEYFTAYDGNYGEYKKTIDTFAVHHFANAWLTVEYLNERETRQRIRSVLGNNILGRLVEKVYNIGIKVRQPGKKIKHYGLKKVMLYYFKKYIKKEKVTLPHKEINI
jgi:hypothetical protein